MRSDARGRNPGEPVRDYAAGQAADLLRRATFHAGRVRKSQHAGSIHDLRVAIRRLSQCLRVFDQFFPPGRLKKVRQKLKACMDLASAVRDLDIALELLRRAALPPDSPLMLSLAEERAGSIQELVAELQLWVKKDVHRKWRSRLGL
ncbi:MAG: CHAD domain-containing protein [Bryobacterales bacterium]|nr:CHAD domain-containing protein [Bryobacterales bacterium]